ncbi:MAG TPA: peroxiredoxin [Thermoplasmata archaeon]|nr:peroxiredoxin [Thermoplasmata archaeon]
MVGVGEIAPDFEGRTGDGGKLALASLRGRPLVLYFYPKANTLGCTIEARGFAEHYSEFQKAGVGVVGVSVDTVEDQHGFSEKCQLPFPLIADADKSIARRYGALGLLGVAKRVTFLIDADGKILEVHQGALPGAHVKIALERLVTGSAVSGPKPSTPGDAGP